ncbi:MAG TPA: helix-hairpin-helix domain-containing protein [Longimicrobium sp.]|nr:helix-hairpin-helix domain-containing protein [Longimicrobium sp.]
MAATPQERLALGVAALLLAGGAAARALRTEPADPALTAPPAAEASASHLAAQVADSVERAERRSTPLAPGERIDPNTASADELDRLPKVGPALAQRIVDWRASHGAFRTMADLDSVPGVGPALLRDAGPHLALAPAPSTAGNREQGTGNSGQQPGRALSSTRDPSQSAASVADWDRSRKRSASSPGAQSGPVEVNRATAEELATLPGIGPALARRIVEWRGANGPFGTVDDLEKVPGIGPATVERLRPRVRATP